MHRNDRLGRRCQRSTDGFCGNVLALGITRAQLPDERQLLYVRSWPRQGTSGSRSPLHARDQSATPSNRYFQGDNAASLRKSALAIRELGVFFFLKHHGTSLPVQ